MIISKTIKEKLDKDFNPEHIEIIDESHKHSGNRKESHFKVILVSLSFEGLITLKRHQAVYKTLNEELKGKIHALSLRTSTPTEWSQEKKVPLDSPKCAGKR